MDRRHRRVARVIPSAPLPEFRPGVGATASARFIGQTCAARRESPRRPRIQRQRLALSLAHFQPTEARPLPLVRVPHQTALYGIVMAVVGLGERFLLGGSSVKAIFKTILLHPSNWGRIRRTNRYPSMLAPAYRRISHNGSRNSRSAPTLHSPAISRRVVLACAPFMEGGQSSVGALFSTFENRPMRSSNQIIPETQSILGSRT